MLRNHLLLKCDYDPKNVRVTRFLCNGWELGIGIIFKLSFSYLEMRLFYMLNYFYITLYSQCSPHTSLPIISQ